MSPLLRPITTLYFNSVEFLCKSVSYIGSFDTSKLQSISLYIDALALTVDQLTLLLDTEYILHFLSKNILYNLSNKYTFILIKNI